METLVARTVFGRGFDLRSHDADLEIAARFNPSDHVLIIDFGVCAIQSAKGQGLVNEPNLKTSRITFASHNFFCFADFAAEGLEILLSQTAGGVGDQTVVSDAAPEGQGADPDRGVFDGINRH
jgi:hypothetical protein